MPVHRARGITREITMCCTYWAQLSATRQSSSAKSVLGFALVRERDGNGTCIDRSSPNDSSSQSQRAIHSERGREQRRNSHATPMAGRPEAANIPSCARPARARCRTIGRSRCPCHVGSVRRLTLQRYISGLWPRGDLDPPWPWGNAAAPI